MIRQVMEGAGLTLWPILSFIIFLTSCGLMLLWLYRPGSTPIYGRMARMALENDDAKHAGEGEEG
ncbi:MAG: hypothetical protein JF616_16805 [Fibrobacteres bacterium]|jgi:hypothetical protein|nr:hypothetical protein [Fibrobacterota bacterium]